MKHTLKKWKASNYEVEIIFTPEDQSKEKQHVLLTFQKDMEKPGYRKGHVPLDIVEKNVDPQYFEMAVTEHIINHALQHILAENSDIKFIGEPYGYNQNKKDDQTTVTIFLDVYPEVEIKKDDWKKESIKPISTKVEEKEIEEALHNLKKNYADYQDTDKLEKDTVSKIALNFIDKKGETLEKWTSYIGEPEFNEDPFWEKTFVGKKKGEVIDIKYDEKKLPIVLQVKDKENKPETLKVTISDVKKQVLPEFTPETIEKLFWKQSEVKDEKQLKEYIKDQLAVQKEQNELIKGVEEYVSKIREKFMSVIIPKTMIDEEFKSRVHSLEHRFGSKEKVQEYMKSMTEEQAKDFVDSIQKASAESLEKFFILNKVAELLGIDLDRENGAQNFGVERRIYEYFNPTEKKEEKKAAKAEKKETKKEEKAEKKSKK